MIKKFWESMGSSLAERWLEYLFGSSFFFWVGGFILYCQKNGYSKLLDQEKSLNDISRGAIIIGALIVLIFSSLLMKELRFPIRRVLEGFWPKPFNSIAYLIIKRNVKDFEKKRNRLRELIKEYKQSAQEVEQFEPQKCDELLMLERWAHMNPPKARDLLPTRLGNLLRAYEEAPESRYGLSVGVVWTRLWILLDEQTRTDISNAQNTLEKFCELWLFGVLFAFWGLINPLAYIISLLWILIVYYVMILSAAEAYGQMIESTFDLHRMKLYESLTWKKPKDTTEEIEMGKQLTEYFWRGTLPKPVTYVEAK